MSGATAGGEWPIFSRFMSSACGRRFIRPLFTNDRLWMDVLLEDLELCCA